MARPLLAVLGPRRAARWILIALVGAGLGGAAVSQLLPLVRGTRPAPTGSTVAP